MEPTKVALFIVEGEDHREWVDQLSAALGFHAVVPKKPSLQLVVRAAPDLIVFDAQFGVPTHWVQLLQSLREMALFEKTPVLIVSGSQQLPSAMLELRNVASMVKPLSLNAVFRQLELLGVDVDRRSRPPREKSDKFRILDTPSLLERDLKRGAGRLGCAVLFLDIDHFKQLNSLHLEREVDRRVLGPYQRLLSELVEGNGHVYAEGGDEVIIWLPNVTSRMALLFAETVREQTQHAEFEVEGGSVRLTVSVGVAVAPRGAKVGELPDWANAAKRRAKEEGRNRVVLYGGDTFITVPHAGYQAETRSG